MASVFYRTVETYGGEFVEVDAFPVFQSLSAAGTRVRRSKCRPTSEVQAALNRRRAERRLIRLVHANFSEKDLTVHLTYRDEYVPNDDDRAKKDVQNYIARLKRRYKKQGIEFKYVCVTEKGKKKHRYHHHLIISGGIDRDIVERIWAYGRANSRRLQFGDDGVAGLSVYILKDAEVWKKRWCASRNLHEPQEKVYDYKLTKRDAAACVASFGAAKEVAAKLYPEWELMSRPRDMINEINGGYYITLRLRKKCC